MGNKVCCNAAQEHADGGKRGGKKGKKDKRQPRMVRDSEATKSF